MNKVITLGESRPSVSVVNFVERELGYVSGGLKRSKKYHDFGTFSAMVDQAVSEGIIKYRPKMNGRITLYLPNEIPDDKDGET